MPHEFLHQDKEFADLIRIVGEERPVDSVLVEKDYWIMHCLYGLQQMGLSFELKGGTSLSKGYGIIDRFSEDIDIRIEPRGFPANFMRHYYDIFCLLQEPEVRTFIGTRHYKTHKQNRFRKKDNPVLAKNEAFLLSDPATREIYADAYARPRTLYYALKPDFETIMNALAEAVTIEGV